MDSGEFSKTALDKMLFRQKDSQLRLAESQSRKQKQKEVRSMIVAFQESGKQVSAAQKQARKSVEVHLKQLLKLNQEIKQDFLNKTRESSMVIRSTINDVARKQGRAIAAEVAKLMSEIQRNYLELGKANRLYYELVFSGQTELMGASEKQKREILKSIEDNTEALRAYLGERFDAVDRILDDLGKKVDSQIKLTTEIDKQIKDLKPFVEAKAEEVKSSIERKIDSFAGQLTAISGSFGPIVEKINEIIGKFPLGTITTQLKLSS